MCNDDTVSKLKNDFHYTLSKFSHEIRNPLTLISSELQMISSAHPEVEDYDHWNDVMDNLAYVTDLLDDLSVFNNAGRIRLEATDTCDYLKTVISSIKPTLDYLGITFESHIPESLPVLMLDKIRIREMLLNLLKNAWEAVPVPGGKISVSAFSKNPVSVSILKTMDAGFQKNCWTIFFSRFSQQKNLAPASDLPFPDRLLKLITAVSP